MVFKKGRRQSRRSHYGRLPATPKASGVITPYGAKKFRTGGGFVGQQGSPMPAYVLDIDGTLMTYGSGADKKVMEWVNEIHTKDPDTVFLVVTARDHGSFGYDTSFDWLMRNFPHPFIGPFARGRDDPRYASEFKRELAQGFEDMGLYQIMGAADDNNFVNDMWEQWAVDHFEDPADFSLLKCSYGSYDGWRKDLPAKGKSRYAPTINNNHDGESWVASHWDADGKVWIKGEWVKETAHRPAGTSRWAKNDSEVTPGGGPVDISNDPRWAHYVASQEKVGHYLGEEADDVLDSVLEAVDNGYSVDRSDLELIVAHETDFTTADIAAMDVTELRELAGITDDDVRQGLLVRVNRLYGDRYRVNELELLNDDELDDLMDMDVVAADALVDAAWIKSLDSDVDRGVLEAEVYADYDVTDADLKAMSIEDLKQLSNQEVS